MGFGHVGFRLRCTWPHNSLIIYQKLQGTVAFSLGKANIQDRSNEKLHVRVTTVKYGRKTRKKKPRFQDRSTSKYGHARSQIFK